MTLRAFRQWHRFLAPVMVVPLILTAITGSFFQFAELSGHEKQYKWLLDIHKGHFGALNLEAIYPFFNMLGLLTLAITGTAMWWRLRKGSPKESLIMPANPH